VTHRAASLQQLSFLAIVRVPLKNPTVVYKIRVLAR